MRRLKLLTAPRWDLQNYIAVTGLTGAGLRMLKDGRLKGYQRRKRGWWRIIRRSVTAFERALAQRINPRGVTPT